MELNLDNKELDSQVIEGVNIQQQIQEINEKSKQEDIKQKYKLKGVKIPRNFSYNNELFEHNVTGKWFDKDKFLKTMKKRKYFDPNQSPDGRADGLDSLDG